MTIKEKYQKKADEMPALLMRYFDEASEMKTGLEEKKAQRALLSLLVECRRDFKRAATKYVETDATEDLQWEGCPRDWTRCDDGSCVPPGESCEN